MSSEDDRLLQASLLLVDDDVGMIRVLRQMLNRYQDLRFATSGPEAIRLALERPPDLLLLDAEMPEMRGVEVFRRFQADPQLAQVTVIFLTGHASSEMEAATLDQGAADFLSKPVSAIQVNARVRAQLRLRQLVHEQKNLAERLELALDAGRLGAWEWLLEADRMIWHRSMQILRGEGAPRVQRFVDHAAGLAIEEQTLLREAFEKMLSSMRPQTVEYSIQLGNDKRRMRSSMSPVLDASGQLSRIVGVDQDITETHRATTLLQGANRQLEQFVYFTSHDLQAPARQSAAFAELALKRLSASDNEGAGILLQRVIEGCARQQQQIQSFLDLARHRLTEPGEWRHVNMGEIVQLVLKDLNQLIDDRKVIVELSPMTTRYLPVNLVAHVWRNLIANAIRHQQSAEPKVWLSQREEDGVPHYFVEDNGGDGSKLIKIISADSSASHTGGLGLQICLRILRVLGGKLSAELGESGGARISFSIGGETPRLQ